MLNRISKAVWFGLGICVLIGFVFVVWWSSIQSPYHEAIKTAAHAAENKTIQDIAAETVAYYTKVLAWFTGLLVAVSGLQGYFLLSADKTARISAEAAIAANRAWVHIKEVRFTKPLKIAPVGAVSSVEVKTENVGRSPALGVSVWVQLIPLELAGANMKEIQTQVRNEAFFHATDLLAGTIFPNQITPHDIGLSVLSTQWEKAILKKEGMGEIVCFMLGVCVCYRLGASADIKYTCRIFNLGWIPIAGDEVLPERLNIGLDSSQWDSTS